MKKAILSLAAVGALTTTAPASAALLTYKLDGIFEDGRILSGGFSYNDDYSVFYLPNGKRNLSSNIDVSGVSFKYNTSFAGEPDLQLGFYSHNEDTSIFVLYLNAVVSPGQIIRNIETGSILSSTFLVIAPDDILTLKSGSISLVSDTAAVPEPATWMMLVLGFGVVGYAMRRKTVLRYV